jgi:hypothetical protein
MVTASLFYEWVEHKSQYGRSIVLFGGAAKSQAMENTCRKAIKRQKQRKNRGFLIKNAVSPRDSYPQPRERRPGAPESQANKTP